MSCTSSPVKVLVSLIYTIVLPANGESLTSSFLICILLISFCCLTSSSVFNRYGESEQHCLVPDFSGIALSFSPFSLMLDVGLLYIAFRNREGRGEGVGGVGRYWEEGRKWKFL